ncbi:hypothetical protein NX059_003982 [Plenodomus lindquistii]|nr:hypothetical protein NX059_003982 [Plenodomus lindquistii]
MKLKLKNPNAAPGDAPAPPAPPAPPAEPPSSAGAATPVSAKPGGLKIKLKPAAPAAPAAPVAPDAAQGANGEGAKAKRKYTKKPKFDESGNAIPPGKPGPKKRARDDENDEFDTPVAKRKPKPTAKSLAMVNESSDDDDDDMVESAPPPPRAPANRVPSLKLSIKAKAGASGAPTQPGTKTAILKVKGAGKPPVRPYGVGYDSEAEEAEPDPAIESQFVLRMQPGPDCDLLRKAIEEKTIGKPVSAGGPGVYFRFFDREGRRALVQIQHRQYAATMVELPAVIESLKSWNKKDWVKTADICQMLLVLGRVQSEDEAKKYPRPPYVDPDSHRFPHGLTPPMQWARKLRFRPRKSYLDVERAEAQMNRLLAEDERATSTRYELIDSGDESSDDSSSEEELDDDQMQEDTQMQDEVDAAALEQMLHEGLMEDDEVEVTGNGDDLDALFGSSNNTLQVETPTTAHDVAMHALNPNASITLETETAASTPGAATSADDDDDDDDADSDDDVDEVDEAAAAEEQRQEQLRVEIAELEKAIAQSVEQRDRYTNTMFKKRLQATIDKQKADLIIKQRQLNEEVED